MHAGALQATVCTLGLVSYTFATRMPMRRRRQATSPATSAVLMRCFTMARDSSQPCSHPATAEPTQQSRKHWLTYPSAKELPDEQRCRAAGEKVACQFTSNTATVEAQIHHTYIHTLTFSTWNRLPRCMECCACDHSLEQSANEFKACTSTVLPCNWCASWLRAVTRQHKRRVYQALHFAVEAAIRRRARLPIPP